MSHLPAFAKAWFLQRETGARAVEEIEARELRSLSESEALALADAVLAATPIEAALAARRVSSGFVEQQRLLARGRR